MTSGCALPGRFWVCGRSAGRSGSCASRERPLQDWLDNWQLRGIPCGPISSRACKPPLNPTRFAGVQVLGVDEHVWHHQDRRRRGPRELTGIVDHSREGSSHGKVEWTWSREGLAPCTRTGWPSAEKTFARECESRHWIFSRDSKNAIGDQLQDATSVLDAFHVVKLAGDAPGEVRRRVQQDTTGHRGRKGDPLDHIRLLLRAPRDRHTKRQQERLREAFTEDQAHIRVKVAYHCAQQVRDVFHQATPAQGRRLTTHLIERLPTCPIPKIARLGWTLRTWKDALEAYFDTAGASNAPHQSHQRNHRTRQTHRQRLPQPHQLPTPNAPHRRRPRRLPPHPTMKSRINKTSTTCAQAQASARALRLLRQCLAKWWVRGTWAYSRTITLLV